MFNRFLASIGIGSAQLDTVLEKARYSPGDEIRGVVRIKGGKTEQRIETISLSVMTEYLRESGDNRTHHHGEAARIHVSAPFTLQAGEHREVPFSFILPHHTPLTVGRTPVWVKTELDIRGGVDPGDNDRIEVTANSRMHTVLAAMEELGFRLHKADCEYAPRLGLRVPFVQEFEFVPTAGPYRGRLDELEVVFLDGDDSGLELLLQIDRRVRGLSSLFAEAANLDESLVRLRLEDRELSAGPRAAAQRLNELIARYSR